MSASAHVLPKSRDGQRMGDWKMEDTMIKDGLWCAFNDYHMGITAENLASKHAISREDQDAFACASQNKASSAQQAGKFDKEIVPINVGTRKNPDLVFDTDEYIKHQVSVEGLAKLRPAFKKDGSVTAANASGINDGAAVVAICSEDYAKAIGATPMARIVSYATAGVDPSVMGEGPIPSSLKALDQAGWSVEDLDVVEANEAFAAQALTVGRSLGLDSAKVNINGGAIAIGHPIGASGARILTTLLHEMDRQGKGTKGLATLCIGGGQGVAMCVEAL